MASLHLAWQRPDYSLPVGQLTLCVAPERLAPFIPDAEVVEEDTSLVLGDYHPFRPSDESATRLVKRMVEAPRVLPGQVLVRPGRPVRLLAVVHDLDREPTWREPWIYNALVAVLHEAAELRLNRVALPLLGTRHGRLTLERFLELLAEVLQEHVGPWPRQVWLVVPPGAEAECIGRLQGHGL